MQTKKHAIKKSHSYSNRDKICKGLNFVVENENAHSSVFINSVSLNCIEYFFISTGAVFLGAKNI